MCSKNKQLFMLFVPIYPCIVMQITKIEYSKTDSLTTYSIYNAIELVLSK